LAGETYSYDSSEELMYSTKGNVANNSNNNNNTNGTNTPNNSIDENHNIYHEYANKHVPQVIHRSYGDDTSINNKIVQTIHDGSQLNVQNLMDPNYNLSIHKPILITDTAKSIGMKVPRGEVIETKTTNTDTIDGNAADPSNDKTEETANTIPSNADATTNDPNTNNPTTITKPITIREIGELIGMDHPVSVMDVKTQDEMEGWIISDLVEYFEDEDRLYQIRQSNTSFYYHHINKNDDENNDNNKNNSNRNNNNNSDNDNYNYNNFAMRQTNKKNPTRPISSKPRVLNQISLEFSNTSLRNYTLSPSFVRELDWIDNIWPYDKRYDEDGDERYPRVQYYCLTSTAGCYTDFHIDFGGTSVWYHVLSGKKVFLLLPPTKRNVRLYESWLCSKNQPDIYFPDMKEEKKDGAEGEEGIGVESCVRITLEENQTFIIPTGWIHAVYTPVDSIVIGGNFLHGLDMKGQLDIHCLETRTRVPAKFRFPYFVHLMFYAGKEYYKRMVEPNGVLYKEEVGGMETLIQALRSWALAPGGDVDREGSVAHVIKECTTELGVYGIKDIEGMLNKLDSELKKIKANGGEKKRLSPINALDESGTADVVSSSHRSLSLFGGPNKIKLSLKLSSAHLNKINPTDDHGTNLKGSKKLVLNNGNKSATSAKPKRQKIGDLASKRVIDDDEWLPGGGQKKKVRKRKQPTSKAVKSSNENVKNSDKNDAKGVQSRKKGRGPKNKSVSTNGDMKKKLKGANARSRLKKKLGM
jgi:hypothetical protein